MWSKKMLAVAFLLPGVKLAAQSKPLWNSKAFAVYADRVTQGKYTAKALSDKEVTSDYESPANNFKSAGISFKFSINGKDNEMRSGVDHHFNAVAANGKSETPVIKFGDPVSLPSSSGSGYLQPDTKLTIRLNMKDVLASFAAKGYFVTFSRDTIYKQDFKAVYVAGSSAPLIWDFNNLSGHKELEMKDPDGDGIYETTLVLNPTGKKEQTASHWKLSKDVSAFPQYTSTFPISDAIYNLALEEMTKAVEPDSTFRTGKEWAGVWTRDISYSIILSMAYLQPRVARYSLLRKVNKKKKVIQDTGTGGAWPVSTDRMIWAVAAWELYKVTGDRDWLQEAYTIISNSLQDDYVNDYDKVTGLVKGESSFLDWREQTYPKWMQPADIYQSENLGTNAVHYQANIVAGQMAALLNKKTEAQQYNNAALKIKNGINRYLWMPAKGFYGQFLYGRTNLVLSPRSEALGEALAVIFDVADAKKQKQIVSSTPVNAYGIPCIYPQIPDIPPYHNNAVWPFVQTYWLWAAAKAGNETSVMESIAAIYRPASLFLTNKENFVAENGDFLGTQINSSNMLWSLSGNLSIVHKVLFGIHFNEDNITFRPFVPKDLGGRRQLTNFAYRNAILDIEMEGYGNQVKSFSLDGKEQSSPVAAASLTSRHRIKIVLMNNAIQTAPVHRVEEYTSLPAPVASWENGKLSWSPVRGAVSYQVLKDGKPLTTTKDTSVQAGGTVFSEYAVLAIDKNQVSSFAGEPVEVINRNNIQQYEAEDFAPKAGYDYKGFSGTGFAEINNDVNTVINIPFTITGTSVYILDCKYANGNGPVNTENKCAIRTVKIDGKTTGVFVMPQRGKAEWSNWGMSNALQVPLAKGRHVLSIEYLPANENMNGATNQAMLDFVRVISK